MSTFNVNEPIASVQTQDEFSALLERYKVSNPAKYAAKLARGEFGEFAEKLAPSAKADKKTKEEKESEENVDEKTEEKTEEKVEEKVEEIKPTRGRKSVK